MVRVVRWLPVMAFVLALPVVADDETKKPTEPDKKEEMKKDAPKPEPKPEAKPEPKAKTPEKKYDEIVTLQGKLKKVDSKTSELHVEIPLPGNKGRKTEELTMADDLKVLSKFAPEEVGDDGKAKKLSGAELAKLKDPNPKFKGLFTSDVNHLQANQMVEVVVGRLKENAPKRSAKNKADDKEGLVVIRVVIVMDDRMNPFGKDKANAKTPPKKS